MEREIDYEPIYKCMGEIINGLVKYYAAEDYETDKELIREGQYGVYSWFVGESGTHLYQLTGPGFTKQKRNYQFYKAQCVRETCACDTEYLIIITADGNYSIKLIAEPAMEIIAV